MSKIHALLTEAEGVLFDINLPAALDEAADVEGLTALHERLRFVADRCTQLAALVNPVLVDAIQAAGTNRVQTSLGPVRVSRKAKEVKVDGPRLLAAVVSRALDERVLDEESGAYEPESQAVARVLDECAPICTPSFKWRKGGLEAHGLKLSDFETVGRWDEKAEIESEFQQSRRESERKSA